MKPDVFVAAHNVISSLGFTTEDNFENLKMGKTGIGLCNDKGLSQTPFYASAIDTQKLDNAFKKLASPDKYTRFEKILILSIDDTLQKTKIDIKSKRTLLIFSTTKGNIDLLEQKKLLMFGCQRIHLWASANEVKCFFGNPNRPVMVSNACISGSLAIIVGLRMIQSGLYDHAVVASADILSEFVVSGFQSFMAMSGTYCKPYDSERDGLNLGEGCASMVLTRNADKVADRVKIRVSGGASSNDANHISGPSRTGEGLSIAIGSALQEAGLTPNDIHYISAHGTATVFNDEMEAKAMVHSGLNNVPLNSFKGYFGHTLGAAGTLESILAIKSMKENTLINTYGYKNLGVSEKINVITQLMNLEIKHVLKTSSGFGGCNAAVVFSKEETST